MNWLRRMMTGRNGTDQLSLATLVVGVLLLVAARLSGLGWLSVGYYLCCLYFFFRVLSRNVYRRRNENHRFVTALNRAKAWCKLRVRIMRELPSHKYLKCPACRQQMRVPRGKGKINIRCHKCGNQFVRKV